MPLDPRSILKTHFETDPGIPIETFSVPEPGTALLLSMGLALGMLFGRCRRRVPAQGA